MERNSYHAVVRALFASGRLQSSPWVSTTPYNSHKSMGLCHQAAGMHQCCFCVDCVPQETELLLTDLQEALSISEHERLGG